MLRILKKNELNASLIVALQDWPKHRKWCKFETVESDEEWTTDSEQNFIGEYTDEEEEPTKRFEGTKKKARK